jgi:hypothetical protein
MLTWFFAWRRLPNNACKGRSHALAFLPLSEELLLTPWDRAMKIQPIRKPAPSVIKCAPMLEGRSRRQI